jgi:hypothetical protein
MRILLAGVNYGDVVFNPLFSDSLNNGPVKKQKTVTVGCA